jgi:hypothetical protein
VDTGLRSHQSYLLGQGLLYQSTATPRGAGYSGRSGRS